MLTHVHRPKGQVYQPEAVAKTVQRYGFAKSPNLDDLASNAYKFEIGKFDDVQIQEMGVYNDGVIVASRSNTKILDSFLDDLFKWLAGEFGIVSQTALKPERYYESQLIIKSKIDLASTLKPASAVLNLFNQTWGERFDTKYGFAGFHLDCGPKYGGRRKPSHFSVERRVGLSFDENIFYSGAPLSTNDHLDLLTKLEALGG